MSGSPTTLRLQLILLAGILLGAAVGVWGASTSPGAFWPTYLVAFLFWWQVSIGFLSLALLRCIIRSNWGVATRPYLNAGLSTIPLTALLFLPLIFGMDHIFPWASASHAESMHHNPFQEAWFEKPFFLSRSIGYLVVWLVAAAIAVPTVRETGEPRLPRRLASLGLMATVLTSTFAAFDWGMSLEPEWYSTIYGALVLMSGVVAALSVLVVSYVSTIRVKRFPRLPLRGVLHDLGNLMLAFLMIWAYFAFSQYLIIWAGNLPSEVTWYVRRSDGSWQAILLLLAVIHFALPFAMLLSRENKQNPRRLASVGCLLLVANLIQTVWTYAPSFAERLTDLHWFIVTNLLAVGGAWLLLYRIALGRSLRRVASDGSPAP